MADDTTTDFQLYRYKPSLPAAIIFILLFLVLSILHTYQLLRRRTWFFIPFCAGGFLEAVGYVGRAIGSQETYGDWSTGPFILQSIPILVAPALFAASIYMELGRIIRLTNGTSYAVVRINWLTKIFVTGDVISFFMQGAGE
jgi:hypothetical protein